jgi:hypothetical protein
VASHTVELLVPPGKRCVAAATAAAVGRAIPLLLLLAVLQVEAAGAAVASAGELSPAAVLM